MDNSLLLNRELSWIEFNQRVLDQALDDRLPPLERLKFLAITSSNLDEFFMVRVGGLKFLLEQESTKKDSAGLTVREQLNAVRTRIHKFQQDQDLCLTEGLEPLLKEAGVERSGMMNVDVAALDHLQRLFEEEVFPVLTPMEIGPETEFPVLTNLKQYLAVRLHAAGKSRYFLIPLSSGLHRFYSIPSEKRYEYIAIEDLVSAFVSQIFPGQDIQETVPFRITRNADMAVQEDMAYDLLSGMEDILEARRSSSCIRLQIRANVSDELKGFLQTALCLEEEDIYLHKGPLANIDFMKIATADGFPELQVEPWESVASPDVPPHESIFDSIRARDILIHTPYEHFDPVVRLVEEASRDENVLAIKQILYRTSAKSPIVAALIEASRRGKQVTAIVELKARFDEQRNMDWARAMEAKGVQVIYGIKGLKTHAKVCVVVRRESQGIMRYMHFGTGNYNESTAKLYGDVSILTCHEGLGAEATQFFNTITGLSEVQQFRHLAMAPLGIRQRILDLIETEIEYGRQGHEALIRAKVNSLIDPKIIDALYRASQAGVTIELNVRGICTLRPGIKGLSENIKVISVVDRYLEHSRVCYFNHGGEPEMYISSADWMPRNLDKRIELFIPVTSAAIRKRLGKILKTYFADRVQSWALKSNGDWVRRSEKDGLRSQRALMDEAIDYAEQANKNKAILFEPHRSS